jgi:hypothetical protein
MKAEQPTMKLFTLLACGWLINTSAWAFDLNQLGWLSGHWVSDDGAAEEVWLAPRGGSMTGSFRWVFPNGSQVLEYLVIEQKGEDITFRFKHFGTDFVPQEKNEPNTYRLVDLTADTVTFKLISDNPKAPQRYQYRRTGDTLTFRGERPDMGEPLVIEFKRK